jgi:hypothetical protein
MSRATVDTWIAVTVIGAYFIAGLMLLAGPERGKLLGATAAILVLLIALARMLPALPMRGLSMLGVAFTAGFILLVPLLPATHQSPVPLLMAAAGMQVAMLLWAVLRWEPSGAARSRLSLAQAVRYGLWAAGGLAIIATFPILTAVIRHVPEARRMFWIYPAYLVGFLAAALVIWSLQRIAHLAVGRYLLGVVGGTLFYAAIAPVVLAAQHERFDFGLGVLLAYGCGALVGPAVAFSSSSAI